METSDDEARKNERKGRKVMSYIRECQLGVKNVEGKSSPLRVVFIPLGTFLDSQFSFDLVRWVAPCLAFDPHRCSCATQIFSSEIRDR
jgi:hypothetical protein